MQVILLKDCPQGNANQVIEVKDGYAINYLIKNGFALPYNQKTKYLMEQKNLNLKSLKKDQDSKNLLLKKEIEKLNLVFKLKVHDKTVHGSITRKQILKALKENKLNLNPHQIDNVKINTIGKNTIKINLNKNNQALLKIEVKKYGD